MIKYQLTYLLKGKPAERRGCKAIGLIKPRGYDRQTAEIVNERDRNSGMVNRLVYFKDVPTLKHMTFYDSL